jgi:hypothetical protein
MNLVRCMPESLEEKRLLWLKEGGQVSVALKLEL